MQFLILSDIHVDIAMPYAIEPNRIPKSGEPEEGLIFETMEWQWKFYNIPKTDGIIIAGDLANDYLTQIRVLKWLSNQYKIVYICLGNHDVVIGQKCTDSKSNLRFKTSEEKIKALIAEVSLYDNVHILENSYRPEKSVAGCMGMCDFKCETNYNTMMLYRNWFDYMNWKFSKPATELWEYYENIMNELLENMPKVMMTHFVPYETGIPFEYRNSNLNPFFYFQGKSFLDKMRDDTYWICGHTHNRKWTEYINDSGKNIHIICNPLGYPQQTIKYTEFYDYRGDKLEKQFLTHSMENFIIEL